MFNKYLLKVFFTNKNSVDYDIIPVIEISKEDIKRKLEENVKVYQNFDLYNYTFNKDDLKNHGYIIYSIEEFFKNANSTI